MKIACVLHSDREPPASILAWAESRHCELLSFNFILEPTKLPDEEIEFVILLGGSFSTQDTEIAPQLSEEIKFIKAAIRSKKPILGICFGMQVLGEALGARTVSNPIKEIGIHLISLNSNGSQDSIIGLLETSFKAFHFHSQMAGLPPGSSVLATSIGCPRQIVRFDKLVYGFQFHPEVDFELAMRMVEDLPDNLPIIEGLRNFDFSRMHKRLFDFLDSLFDKANNLRL